MSAKTMRAWCVAGTLFATVLCASASGQPLAEIAAELDQIEQMTQAGTTALDDCDDSLDGVVATKPAEDDPLERWQAYAENLAQWYLACRALKAGDPSPVLMKLLAAVIAKLPPAPSGPNAVDPAKDLRERGTHLDRLIANLGLRWMATHAAWVTQREIIEAAIRAGQQRR